MLTAQCRKPTDRSNIELTHGCLLSRRECCGIAAEVFGGCSRRATVNVIEPHQETVCTPASRGPAHLVDRPARTGGRFPGAGVARNLACEGGTNRVKISFGVYDCLPNDSKKTSDR